MRCGGVVIMLLLSAALAGCGTLHNCASDSPDAWAPYGGVAFDLDHFQPSSANAAPKQENVQADLPLWRFMLGTCCVVDLPFSFVADTVLLPVTRCLVPYWRTGVVPHTELSEQRQKAEKGPVLGGL